MRLYLVRHGETVLNAQRVHQDHTSVLSDEGRKHAVQNADRLKAYQIDHLLASPYIRTQETAEIISQAIGLPVEYSDLFREIKRPTAIEGLHTDHPDAVAVKRLIAERYDDPAYRHSDEETFFDLRDRAVRALVYLGSLSHQAVLVVSHGDFIKMLVSVAILGDHVTSAYFWQFHSHAEVRHVGITLLDNEDQGHWKLRMWNG